MKIFYNQKHKFYECFDSTIFYQINSYQIAFLIDEKASSKIAKWQNETRYSERELNFLQNSCDGTPSYRLSFFVGKNGVGLSIEILLNYTFQGHFQGKESQDLVYLDAMYCPKIITKPELVVLKIEGQFYQSLVNWQNWIYDEAFLSRYIYQFYENSTFDQKDITVRDLKTSEYLYIHDDSDSL